jgi:DNA-binding response OmpR family regulator
MSAVLIVENDKNQRLLLQEELQADGHDARAAASAGEALETVSLNMPDLVVLDIAMPGMDGLDLLGKLLGLDHRLPVVIYTGYSSYRDNFLSWAADAYVTKRSDLSELKRTIHAVLDCRRNGDGSRSRGGGRPVEGGTGELR